MRVAVQHHVRLMTGDRHDYRVRNAACLEHAREIVTQVMRTQICDFGPLAKAQPSRTNGVHRHVNAVSSWKNPRAFTREWFPADQFICQGPAHRHLSTLAIFGITDYET